MTLPVGSRAAWIATIGSVLVALKSQRPISAGVPASAAATVAALCSRATPFGSGLGGWRRSSRLISACSWACSGPSVAVSKARSSRSFIPGTPVCRLWA